MLIIFFIYLWKTIISLQEFQESLKKHFRAGFVIPCLLYMNLNTLLFYHSAWNFSFNFELESVTLKSLRMQLIRKKVIPERRYFSWQKWDLGCEKHPTWLYFKWENINGFLFKHPVYGKEYKLPHIINLLISQIIRNNSLGILATKFWKFLLFLFRFNFLGITCKKFSVPKVSLFSLVRNILSGSFRMSTLCGHADVSWNQTHFYIQ